MKHVAVTIFFFIIMGLVEASAQCAMCRSTLENNFSNGDGGIAAGINTGILYLLAMPYLAIMILAYFWYRSSRNARKELSDKLA
jgi:hypothetical protein